MLRDVGCVPYYHTLRRRNTIYKNLQLGAQHCFCSSLGSMFLVFRPVFNLARNKILCCKLNNFVAQSRLSFYFEIQVLVLFLVFHRNYNLARNKSLILTNQHARSVQLATNNFVASQINTGYEKRETSNLNLNRNNVASRISPPLAQCMF